MTLVGVRLWVVLRFTFCPKAKTLRFLGLELFIGMLRCVAKRGWMDKPCVSVTSVLVKAEFRFNF